MKGKKIRLTKDLSIIEGAASDFPAGTLGRIVDVYPADDTHYKVTFDLRPALVVDFYEPQFIPSSPEFCIEVVS